jgi:hypothetical protein
MRATKLAGPEASSQKYDLLTALGCHALGCDPGTQRLTLRFLTLVTARYNWRQGVLQVGQREIARLWAVDERTVKREMAKLRRLGWLVLESPARRGRVASYALDMNVIRAATRAAWSRVGSDFEARMAGIPEVASGGTVVPFPRPEPTAEGQGPDRDTGAPLPLDGAGHTWTSVLARLRSENPAVCANWFDTLRARDGSPDCLTLVAPSAFHANYVRTHFFDRLLEAVRAGGGQGGLRILATDDPDRAGGDESGRAGSSR